MPFPQIADGAVSKDKGGVVMNWERSGGASEGKTNIIVLIVRGSWTKGHGGWQTMSKSVRIGVNWGHVAKCRLGMRRKARGRGVRDPRGTRTEPERRIELWFARDEAGGVVVGAGR